VSARVHALIDLNALKHNYNLVRTLAPQAKILAMIKANAYGHGLTVVAKALPADGFGVASLSSALRLRRQGIHQSIVLMGGFIDPNELVEIFANQLDIVVHSQWQVIALSTFAQQHSVQDTINVWLKVDTGMHRLGFAPGDVAKAYQTLANLSLIKKPLTLMTHLAQAYGQDDRAKTQTKTQLNCFTATVNGLSGLHSIANSAAIYAWPEAHRDWVRPGIMLFGISPFTASVGAEHGLKPVMTLVSRIIAINQLHQGDCIGYGGAWCCPENMPVGVVDIGYGDGYPRHIADGTTVLIQGHPCPIVGRVSMDRITVDLRNYPQATVGDDVILWGPDLPVEGIAKGAGTIGYELVSQVMSRVEFKYVNHENQQ